MSTSNAADMPPATEPNTNVDLGSNQAPNNSSSTSNITVRNMFNKRLRQGSDEDCEDSLTIFKTEIKELIVSMMDQQNLRLIALEKHMSEIKSQNNAIHASNVDIEKSLDFMSSQLQQVETKIGTLEAERKKVVEMIYVLDKKQEYVERQQKKTSIEIRGVPKKQDESKKDLFDMIAKLSTAINHELLPHDVRDVYRLFSKHKPDTTTVIVEFSSTLIQDLFLSAAKDFNKGYSTNQLNSALLGLATPKKDIFISEFISPKTKRLHFLAQNFCKTAGYTYCWISRGNVLIRKTHGMPHIVVKDEGVLTSLQQNQDK